MSSPAIINSVTSLLGIAIGLGAVLLLNWYNYRPEPYPTFICPTVKNDGTISSVDLYFGSIKPREMGNHLKEEAFPSPALGFGSFSESGKEAVFQEHRCNQNATMIFRSASKADNSGKRGSSAVLAAFQGVRPQKDHSRSWCSEAILYEYYGPFLEDKLKPDIDFDLCQNWFQDLFGNLKKYLKETEDQKAKDAITVQLNFFASFFSDSKDKSKCTLVDGSSSSHSVAGFALQNANLLQKLCLSVVALQKIKMILHRCNKWSIVLEEKMVDEQRRFLDAKAKIVNFLTLCRVYDVCEDSKAEAQFDTVARKIDSGLNFLKKLKTVFDFTPTKVRASVFTNCKQAFSTTIASGGSTKVNDALASLYNECKVVSLESYNIGTNSFEPNTIIAQETLIEEEKDGNGNTVKSRAQVAAERFAESYRMLFAGPSSEK